MSEQGEDPRLVQLRFLERVQERDLARTRDWIRRREQQLAKEEEEARRRQRPPPAWIVETLLGREGRPDTVHQGGCIPMGFRARAIPEVEARRLLDGDHDLACQICRPDTELGLP
ncbi:DUF6233 domain-containing protein [Streptomyces bacillaris]|uniref:DUF6233 domain-containing protein n=1 Tax=Streptomyces bacillaris TaxID=68179 RepID=UPI003662DD59